MPETDTAKRVRRDYGRSPSYPAISLPRALERVEVLYDREKQYPTPVAAVVQHWGYTTANGPAGLAIAAAKKFGLLTDEGTREDRRVRVTDLAVQILKHPSTKAREQGVREAALKPAFHQELWAKYRTDLPSDANLAWDLTHESGFTDTGASEFVREYRETLAYANLTGGDGAEADVDDQSDESEDAHEEAPSEDAAAPRQAVAYIPPSVTSVRPPAQPRAEVAQPARDVVSNYTIPLPGGKFVLLQAAFPLTEPEWAQFEAVLGAMRPGLVVGASLVEPDAAEG